MILITSRRATCDMGPMRFWETGGSKLPNRQVIPKWRAEPSHGEGSSCGLLKDLTHSLRTHLRCVGRNRREEVLSRIEFGHVVSGLQPALEEIGDHILELPALVPHCPLLLAAASNPFFREVSMVVEKFPARD